jgi:DNA-binding winged helix-turn-helix (wHTH) protein
MDGEFSRAAFPGAPVRAEELRYLIHSIRQGWCCSLVGPSNTGKSFLLKSLPTEEVRRYCTVEGSPPPVMVFIDCLEAGDSEQAFYELLLRRTVEELEQAGASNAVIATLKALHQELLHSANEVAFRAFYASSVRTLSKLIEVRVALILDEFYDVFRLLPPWPFRQLRALYDALDHRLCYITGTSHHLEQLRPGPELYEFRELFHLHTLMLRPLSNNEARQFIAYLADESGDVLTEPQVSSLVEFSGGHPGLLERIYTMMRATPVDLATPLPALSTGLLRYWPIQKECERLWSELEAEQSGLLALIEGGDRRLTPTQRQLLNTKGLMVAKEGEGLTIFSSVFKAFVQTKLASGQPQKQVTNKGLYCDFQTGQIWLGDQEVTLKLSEPQRRLIAFLYQKAGIVCTYDEIAEGVWGVGEGVSPGAIYELVKRVRQKVEPDWQNPVHIITVPGKGYRLQIPA